MLCLVPILILTISTVLSGNNFASSQALIESAYAQSSPSPGGPRGELGGPGAGQGNPGDVGAPGDNSTDMSGSAGDGEPSGPSGGFGNPGYNPADLGPGPQQGNITGMQYPQNSTSSTVPEFGPFTGFVVAISLTGIIIISRARWIQKF